MTYHTSSNNCFDIAPLSLDIIKGQDIAPKLRPTPDDGNYDREKCAITNIDYDIDASTRTGYKVRFTFEENYYDGKYHGVYTLSKVTFYQNGVEDSADPFNSTIDGAKSQNPTVYFNSK